MNSLADRIKEVRRSNKLTQKAFGEKMLVSASYISKVESGKEVPSEMFLKLVSLEFGVSHDWLISSIGEMIEEDTIDLPITSDKVIEEALLALGRASNNVSTERDQFNLRDILFGIKEILSLNTQTKAQKSIVIETLRDIVSVTEFIIQSYSKIESRDSNELDERVEYYFGKCKAELLEVKKAFLFKENE